jgi:hypothetical protein
MKKESPASKKHLGLCPDGHASNSDWWKEEQLDIDREMNQDRDLELDRCKTQRNKELKQFQDWLFVKKGCCPNCKGKIEPKCKEVYFILRKLDEVFGDYDNYDKR